MHPENGALANRTADLGATGAQAHSGPSHRVQLRARGSARHGGGAPGRARPPAAPSCAVPPSFPRAPGEPLKSPRRVGLRGWAEGDDEGAAHFLRFPGGLRGAAAAAATERTTATKRLPRQADFTDRALAVTRRRVGPDVSPAGRQQPGAPFGDAPAPGRPSGRRTPRPAPRPRSGWTGRCQRRPSPGASAARDPGSCGAVESGSGEVRHGDPLQPEEPG